MLAALLRRYRWLHYLVLIPLCLSMFPPAQAMAAPAPLQPAAMTSRTISLDAADLAGNSTVTVQADPVDAAPAPARQPLDNAIASQASLLPITSAAAPQQISDLEPNTAQPNQQGNVRLDLIIDPGTVKGGSIITYTYLYTNVGTVSRDILLRARWSEFRQALDINVLQSCLRPQCGLIVDSVVGPTVSEIPTVKQIEASSSTVCSAVRS